MRCLALLIDLVFPATCWLTHKSQTASADAGLGISTGSPTIGHSDLPFFSRMSPDLALKGNRPSYQSHNAPRVRTCRSLSAAFPER